MDGRGSAEFTQDYRPTHQVNVHSHICEATDPLIMLADTDMVLSGAQDGAACCIIASEDFVHAHKLENQAIEIVAQALETDDPDTYDAGTALQIVGYGMTKRCTDKVFAQAGFAPGQGRDEVGVIELHDCFAPNEVGVMVSRQCENDRHYFNQLISYPALGLCAPEVAHKLVENGDNTVRPVFSFL